MRAANAGFLQPAYTAFEAVVEQSPGEVFMALLDTVQILGQQGADVRPCMPLDELDC